jgi:hypothetical protein
MGGKTSEGEIAFQLSTASLKIETSCKYCSAHAQLFFFDQERDGTQLFAYNIVQILSLS